MCSKLWSGWYNIDSQIACTRKDSISFAYFLQVGLKMYLTDTLTFNTRCC